MRALASAAVAALVLAAPAPAQTVQKAAASPPPSLFTAAQASRGRDEYDDHCQTCHGEHLDDGDFGGPPLRGSYFRTQWSHNTAAGLFSYVKALMPPDNPGGLNDEAYANVLAYILQHNGYEAGADAFPTDAKAQAALKLDALK